MSPPKQHLSDQMVHVIRRTEGRQYFLAPGPKFNMTMEYAFARALQHSECEASAEMTMSNHHHTALKDRVGELSVFTNRFHGLVGRIINDFLDHVGEHFWDNRGPLEVVILVDPENPTTVDPESYHRDDSLEAIWDEHGLDDIDRVMLYIWLNAVRAGLVDRVHHWPGFMVVPDDWGQTKTIHRPRWIPSGYQDEVTYTPMPPAKWGDQVDEARRFYNDLIRIGEEYYREKRHRQGAKVRGRRRCLRDEDGTKGGIHPFDKPKSKQPREKQRPRRTFRGPSHLRVKAIAATGTFYRRHRIARRRFAAGHRHVVFPAGTIQLRKLAGVTVAADPLPDEDPRP